MDLGSTKFTVEDLDRGDLPNGEVITNVSIKSVTGKNSSTYADVGTYTDEIQILSPVTGTDGDGDGFRESNYDISYVSGDLKINRRDSVVVIDDHVRFAGEAFEIDQSAFVLSDPLPNTEELTLINTYSSSGVATDPASPRGFYPDEFVADSALSGVNGFDSNNYRFTFVPGSLEILPYPGLPSIFSEFDHPIWNANHVGLFGLEQLDGPVPITDTILYRIYEICDWSLIQDSKRNSIIEEMEKANNRERTEELLKYYLESD